LWNIDELQAAQKAQINLDNAIKAWEAGAMTDAEVIQELNAKDVFNIDLTEEGKDLIRPSDKVNPLAGLFGNEATDDSLSIENAKWEEEEHPRGDDGKFGSGAGAGNTTKVQTKKSDLEKKDSPAFGTNKKQNVEIAKKLIADEGFIATTENPSGRKIDKSIPAIYNNVTGQVYINPNGRFWKDPVNSAKTAFDSGRLSTESPMGIIYHEVAHGKFKVQDNFMSWEHQQSAGKVSDYAKRNAKEFVSEVYAGIKTGKKYDPEIMTMFKVYAQPRK
jgi:hypothetical protein